MTKIEKVKEHLLRGKPITQRYAIEWFTYYRLASGIHRLRQRGMNIKTTMKDIPGTKYAEYKLENN